MKRLLLLSALMYTLSAKSQNTTQEEYNFMIKGYQQMLESGLDMKKGYLLADTAHFTTQGQKYSFTFLNLVRQKDRSLAGTIILANSKSWNRKYYLGMMAANNELYIDHEKTLMVQISNFGWDTNIKTAFLQSLAEYLSLKMTTAYIQKEKAKIVRLSQ
jgi:hypothetical protein